MLPLPFVWRTCLAVTPAPALEVDPDDEDVLDDVLEFEYELTRPVWALDPSEMLFASPVEAETDV